MLARIYSRLSSYIRPSMTSTSFRHLSSEYRARLPNEAGSIRLTDLEKQICTLLDDFTQVLREDSQDVECCIAGGWVRDKVINLSLCMWSMISEADVGTSYLD